MRKVIIIFAVVLLIAVVAGVSLAFLTRKDAAAPAKNIFPISLLFPKSSSGPSGEPYGTPPGQVYTEYEEDGGSSNALIPFSNEGINGYWISSTTAFFLTKDGDLKKNDGTGEFSLLSYSSYGTPIEVRQNNSGTAAAVIFDSGSAYTYSASKNAWDLLDAGLIDASFSPDGKKIMGLKESGGVTSLIRYEPFGSPKKTTPLLQFNGVDFRLQWPSENKVLLTSIPSYFSEGSVLTIDLQKKTFSKIGAGVGMGALSSQFSSNVFTFHSETKTKMSSSRVSQDGTQLNGYSQLSLESKCGASFSAPMLFCGSPQLLPNSTYTLPDDYLKRKIFTVDGLVQISFTDGEMRTIPFSSNSYVDMSSVMHSNNAVFFINRLDEKLYKLELSA